MKTFTISKGGGRSVQELARATKCEVGGYANDFLNSSDLLAESDTQDAEVVLIQFEKDPTTDEVIKDLNNSVSLSLTLRMPYFLPRNILTNR
jgi:hypothetical protein